MVISWSQAIYVEFVRRAEAACFIQCNVNTFEYFEEMPRRCLYGNAKVMILGWGREGRINSKRKPSNISATSEKKRCTSDTPLVDTRRLRDSISIKATVRLEDFVTRLSHRLIDDNRSDTYSGEKGYL